MNALAVATGEQGLEFFAFDASCVEKLRVGDAHFILSPKLCTE
jgi:hypothetical protein